MAALYFILPLALLVAGGAVAAFAWSVRTGQLDDLETPARRVLIDDEPLARSLGARRPGSRSIDRVPPQTPGLDLNGLPSRRT